MRIVSRKLLHSVLVMSMATGFVACSDDDDDDTSTPAPTQPGTGDQAGQSLTLTQRVIADSRFSTLRTALTEAGLLSVLESGEYTVFAPTNEAFAKIPADQLQALLADKDALTKVLLYHVVPGNVPASEVLAKPSLDSANDGLSLKVSTRDQDAFINDSRILQTDIKAKNGIIHVIDTVLLPPAPEAPKSPGLVDLVLAEDRFTTLKTALVEAGLVETLANGEFTVFAPTNEAFDKIPADQLKALLADKDALKEVLLYHVVPGSVPASEVLAKTSLNSASEGLSLKVSTRDEGAFINDSRIIQTDIKATNGIIHVIDTVLLPPAPEAPKSSGLVDLVLGDDRFTTLKTALVEAGLVETLANGEFTVFAPTNEAFNKIPADQLKALLADKDALKEVLLYHVVPGSVPASEVLAKTSLNSASEGLSLKVSTRDEGAFINDSRIIQTNIKAKNGFIHVIDTVLLPPAPEAPKSPGLVDLVLADDRFTTLKTALLEAGLVETLASGEFTVFAPTNEAFDKIPADQLKALLADKETLTKVLLYHVVPGSVPASEVLAKASLDSANNGLSLKVSTRDEGAFINDSRIIQTNIKAKNGFIHVIDTVLLPPAPETQKSPSLVDLVLTDARFTTLKTALAEAGLVETLASGEYTVFAPTNEAFAKLPAATLNQLLADKTALTKVLLYHVVRGKLEAEQVLAHPTLRTVNHARLAIRQNKGKDKAFVNDSQIIETNLLGTNGVIHVIDTVITAPASR